MAIPSPVLLPIAELCFPDFSFVEQTDVLQILGKGEIKL